MHNRSLGGEVIDSSLLSGGSDRSAGGQQSEANSTANRVLHNYSSCERSFQLQLENRQHVFRNK